MFAITKEKKEVQTNNDTPKTTVSYTYYNDLNGLELDGLGSDGLDKLKDITDNNDFQKTKLYNQYKTKTDDKDLWLASTLLTNETQIKNNSKYNTITEVKNFYEENEAKLAAILEQGIEQGIFKFPGDSKAMAKLIFSFLEGGLFIVRAQGDLKQFRSMMNQCLKLLGAV